VTATGLFLGAGASFEAGMPLVWDLTAQIKAWLTPENSRLLLAGGFLAAVGLPPALFAMTPCAAQSMLLTRSMK
jgi:hypothetical protein